MIEIETITENASSYFCEQIRRTGTRGMFPIDLHHEAMQSLLADIEKVVVVKDTDNDFRAALSALAGELNADEDSLVVDISGAAAGNLPPMDMDCLEAIDQILFVQKYCCPVNFKTAEETFPKPFRIGLRAFFFKKQAP